MIILRMITSLNMAKLNKDMLVWVIQRGQVTILDRTGILNKDEEYNAYRYSSL